MDSKDIKMWMILITAIFLVGLLFIVAWIHCHNVANEYYIYFFNINVADIIFSSILFWLFMYFIGSVLIELGGEWLEERKNLSKR